MVMMLDLHLDEDNDDDDDDFTLSYLISIFCVQAIQTCTMGLSLGGCTPCPEPRSALTHMSSTSRTILPSTKLR